MARTALSGKKPKKSVKKNVEQKAARKSSSSTSVATPKITESVKTKTPKNKRGQNMVLKEVKFYQSSTNFLMAKAPFLRMVREIASKVSNGEIQRITPTSLEVIQEAVEAYMVTVFEKSYSCTVHAKRKTLFPKDIQLYKSINDK